MSQRFWRAALCRTLRRRQCRPRSSSKLGAQLVVVSDSMQEGDAPDAAAPSSLTMKGHSVILAILLRTSCRRWGRGSRRTCGSWSTAGGRRRGCWRWASWCVPPSAKPSRSDTRSQVCLAASKKTNWRWSSEFMARGARRGPGSVCQFGHGEAAIYVQLLQGRYLYPFIRQPR